MSKHEIDIACTHARLKASTFNQPPEDFAAREIRLRQSRFSVDEHKQSPHVCITKPQLRHIPVCRNHGFVICFAVV